MGSRSKSVTGPAKILYAKFFGRVSLDFDCNKKLVSEISNISSKVVRNKTAGYITHLKKLNKAPSDIILPKTA